MSVVEVPAGGLPVWLVLVLLLVHVGMAVVFFVMARLGAAGRLRRNSWFGIRTPGSLSGDEAWERVHRAAAPWMYVASAVVVATVAVLAFVGGGDEGVFTVVVLVGDGVMAVVVGCATVAGVRAVRPSR